MNLFGRLADTFQAVKWNQIPDGCALRVILLLPLQAHEQYHEKYGAYISFFVKVLRVTKDITFLASDTFAFIDVPIKTFERAWCNIPRHVRVKNSESYQFTLLKVNKQSITLSEVSAQPCDDSEREYALQQYALFKDMFNPETSSPEGFDYPHPNQHSIPAPQHPSLNPQHKTPAPRLPHIPSRPYVTKTTSERSVPILPSKR